jgi:hypothetical protein
LNTVRNRRPAQPAPNDPCEELHRPIRSLVWQLFGGFVMVVLTLALAGAAQLGQKADADDLRDTAEQSRQVQRTLGEIKQSLGELRAGQGHLRDELRYVRTVLDEERKR